MTDYCGNKSPITGDCIMGCKSWDNCLYTPAQREEQARKARDSLQRSLELERKSRDA